MTMTSAASAFLKGYKCPLCKAPIDLVGWNPDRVAWSGKKYNFCCANDWEHYRMFLVHWDTPPFIDYEVILIYENDKLYEIRQNLENKTYIIIYVVDVEKRIKEDDTALYFRYDKRLFDFTNTNRDKILTRLKTILVFQ